MQWRALSIEPRDVTLANGETLRTLASFQGADGDRDILKAHIVLDAGDFALVTEFESADGKRQFGRTTQWPREIIYHCMNSPTPTFFDAVDTEINPESEAQGGSGDPAAPAMVIEPKGEPPADPTESDHALMRHAAMASDPALTAAELQSSDAVGHDGASDPNEIAKTDKQPDDDLQF
jgi:hypothetical protein